MSEEELQIRKIGWILETVCFVYFICILQANTKEGDNLVRHPAAAGLILNTSKAVALTKETQPPSFIQVGDSHMIKVLGHTKSHKWLGCMLCACPGQDPDVEFHLQQAAKAFQKHGWMLQCDEWSKKHRLRYFEAFFNCLVRCGAPAIIQKTLTKI